mmetsp:Transcript_10332/g.34156  ORF Transcript_10332/g.34156 Transcript_10332/m.34156 type:complete len:511 (+) Transcript_10332:2044-3576(+)
MIFASIAAVASLPLFISCFSSSCDFASNSATCFSACVLTLSISRCISFKRSLASEMSLCTLFASSLFSSSPAPPDASGFEVSIVSSRSTALATSPRNSESASAFKPKPSVTVFCSNATTCSACASQCARVTSLSVVISADNSSTLAFSSAATAPISRAILSPTSASPFLRPAISSSSASAHFAAVSAMVRLRSPDSCSILSTSELALRSIFSESETLSCSILPANSLAVSATVRVRSLDSRSIASESELAWLSILPESETLVRSIFPASETLVRSILPPNKSLSSRIAVSSSCRKTSLTTTTSTPACCFASFTSSATRARKSRNARSLEVASNPILASNSALYASCSVTRVAACVTSSCSTRDTSPCTCLNAFSTSSAFAAPARDFSISTTRFVTGSHAPAAAPPIETQCVSTCVRIAATASCICARPSSTSARSISSSSFCVAMFPAAVSSRFRTSVSSRDLALSKVRDKSRCRVVAWCVRSATSSRNPSRNSRTASAAVSSRLAMSSS